MRNKLNTGFLFRFSHFKPLLFNLFLWIQKHQHVLNFTLKCSRWTLSDLMSSLWCLDYLSVNSVLTTFIVFRRLYFKPSFRARLSGLVFTHVHFSRGRQSAERVLLVLPSRKSFQPVLTITSQSRQLQVFFGLFLTEFQSFFFSFHLRGCFIAKGRF